MNPDITKIAPFVPDKLGKLAWITARIEQTIISLPVGVKVNEAWIEISPATAAVLAAELPIEECFSGQVYNSEISISTGVLPLVLCVLDELDDTTFTLSLELNSPHLSIHTTGILGFCYSGVVTPTQVETRWVLQHIDGVAGELAASLSNSL